MNARMNDVTAVTQLLLITNNIGYPLFGVSQIVIYLTDLAKSQFCFCLQNRLPIFLSLFWCPLKKALSCSLHLDLKQMHKMVRVLHSPKPLTLTLCDVLNWNRTKNPISRAQENNFWRRIFSVTSWIKSLCQVYGSRSHGLTKWPSCAWRAAGGRRPQLPMTLTL